jgi:hypothetical protein
MKYEWKEAEHHVYYYFRTNDGLIVGQLHNVTYTQIWVAMAIEINVETSLGRYVSLDHAKAAVELHWKIQERTLLEHGNV